MEVLNRKGEWGSNLPPRLIVEGEEGREREPLVEEEPERKRKRREEEHHDEEEEEETDAPHLVPPH